jgi:hypothetical protein
VRSSQTNVHCSTGIRLFQQPVKNKEKKNLYLHTFAVHELNTKFSFMKK